MSRPNARTLELAARALLVLGSTLLCFALVEAGFRLIGWVEDVDFRIYLKELKRSNRLPQNIFRGEHLEPDTQGLATTSDFTVIYRINHNGLRDRDYPYERSPGRRRILALGDSNTFGEGIPYRKRFTDIAEDALENVEIIDAGVPGWGIESELVYLLAEGLRYHPDYVIVFLNLIDTRRPIGIVADGRVTLTRETALRQWREGHSEPRSSTGTWYLRPDDPFFKESNVLVRHSYALSFLDFRISRARHQNDLSRSDATLWNAVLPGGAEASWQEFADGAAKRRAGGELDQNATRVIREFGRIAALEGIGLWVVDIDQYLGDLAFIADGDPNVHYADFRPALRALSKTTPLTFKYDGHLNEAAHRVLGKALADLMAPVIAR